MVDLVLDYLDRSLATFEGDPPSNEYQRGHFDGLKIARAELATLIDWRPMPEAPRDGTLVWLSMDYGANGSCPLADARRAATIGFNNHDRDEDWPENSWQYVAWSWEQDCFHDHESERQEPVPAAWRPIGFDLDQTPEEEREPEAQGS